MVLQITRQSVAHLLNACDVAVVDTFPNEKRSCQLQRRGHDDVAANTECSLNVEGDALETDCFL